MNFKIPPPLDPEKHYVERCAISCVHPRALVQSDPKKQLPTKLLASDGKSGGGTFVFASSGSGDDFNAFDTLEKVRGLMRSLVREGSIGKALDAFSFLWKAGGWESLTSKEKRERYSTFACHELNLFLYHKDPDFFSDVVAPYISDKPEPTFMDAFLLGRDVSRWKRPAEMSQLNALETALLVGANGGIAKGSEQAKSFANRLRQQARGMTSAATQKLRFAAALKYGRMESDSPEIGGNLLQGQQQQQHLGGDGGGGNPASMKRSRNATRMNMKSKARREMSADDDNNEDDDSSDGSEAEGSYSDDPQQSS